MIIFIKTIFVPTLIKTKQLVSLISLTSLNLIEHVSISIELVYVLPIMFDKLIELVSVLPFQIVIPSNSFKQHLPKTLVQIKVGEMEIDETSTCIKIQNLCIVDWTITK
jgi:hypothetical protein